ncbi:MAG: hypothetical protein ACTSVB_05510 [Candidatus Heimdallarchaeaceae archaeon]
MVTWTEIDDLTCDIEDLRFEPEKASEVAIRFKEMAIRIAKEGIDDDELKLYILEFWDNETEEYFKYLIITSEDLEKVREAREKIQEEYNKICMDFVDFDEVYKWLNKKIKVMLPDAEPIDFILV